MADPRWAGLAHRLSTVAGSLALAGLLLAGCSAPPPTEPGPSPSPGSSSQEGCPPSADPLRGNDLMNLLSPPAGYRPIPDDPISGPIDCATVPVIFSDHPEDAGTILDSGFVAGAVAFWQDEPADDPTMRDLVTLGVIVVQFDTPEHAEAVLGHFRTVHGSDADEFFDVPGVLAGGYGVQSEEPDSFETVFYGIVWRHGSYVVTVSYSSSALARDTAPVVDVALTVDAELP